MDNRGFASLLGLCLALAMMFSGGGLFVILRQNIADTSHYVQETHLRLLAESGQDDARARLKSGDLTVDALTNAAASSKELFDLRDGDFVCQVRVRKEANDFYIMSLAEGQDWNQNHFTDYRRVVGLYKKKVDTDELEWSGYWP